MEPQIYEDVRVEQPAAGVGLVQLNRPEVLNALRGQLMEELVGALETLDRDPAIGAMVITGNEKAFSAGADIGEMANATPLDMRERGMIERWHRLPRRAQAHHRSC